MLGSYMCSRRVYRIHRRPDSWGGRRLRGEEHARKRARVTAASPRNFPDFRLFLSANAAHI